MAHAFSHLPPDVPPDQALHKVVGITAAETNTRHNSCWTSPDIPASRKEAESPLSPSATSINGGSRSALVVENDKCLLKMFKNLLEREDYVVRTACDGEEGLRLYERCQPFFVVIINYCLPMNDIPNRGVALATAIRRISPSQKMIIAAFDYQHEEEVPRPSKVMDIPLLIDIAKLRRVVQKLWVDQAIEALTSADLLSRAPPRCEMLLYLQPSWNYTFAHLIKSKEETWQPRECPNHPLKTQ